MGEGFRYNNSAYALAGLVIEKVSGMSYENYLLEYILRPIGATTSNPLNPTPAMVETTAMPYHGVPGERPIPLPFGDAGGYPAGGAYLRAEEMARFLGVHINGGVFAGKRIISEELLVRAHTANKEMYGLGWWTRTDEAGHTRIMHGGRLIGYSTTIIGDKDTGFGVYVMTNDNSQACYRIADAAVKLLRGEEYDIDGPEIVSIAPAILRNYHGLYHNDKDGSDTLMRSEGGNLVVSYPGSSDDIGMTYVPLSATRFYNRSFGTEIEFRANAAGEFDGYHMVQHGWLDYGWVRKTGD